MTSEHPDGKQAPPSAKPIRVRVSRAAEREIRAGHPWIYSDSIQEQGRAGTAGELAVVYDHDNRFLAIGLLDPQSAFRIRVLQALKPAVINAGWWLQRLRAAAAEREGWFGGSDTTGYRLIHGESEGWPGLVLDRYGQTLVLKIYSEVWRPWLNHVLEAIQAVFPAFGVVLRLSQNLQTPAEPGVDAPPGWTNGAWLGNGPQTERSEFLENGLRFEADVVRGQKTGFFLDQHENRLRVQRLSNGARVLNAFSYTGGFSLYAARGGAREVVSLDISSHALDGVRRHFELNSATPAIAACRQVPAQDDAFEWLGRQTSAAFDLVILDPPSFARREAERQRAIHAYHRLAQLGLRQLKPGGRLVAASCSAHVTTEEFKGAVLEAIQGQRRRFEVQEITAHPQDHPARFREAAYLKCLFVRC